MEPLVIIYAIASALFWIGCGFDAVSSVGQFEKTSWYQNSQKRFSMGKYVIIHVIAYAVVTVVVQLFDFDEVTTVSACASLVGMGVWSYLQSRKNNALKKAQAR